MNTLGPVLEFALGRTTEAACRYVGRVSYEISRIAVYAQRNCEGPQPYAWQDLTQREQQMWERAAAHVLQLIKEGLFDEKT